MNQKLLGIGVLAFALGLIISGSLASYAVNGGHQGIMNMYDMHSDIGKAVAQDKTMNQMTADLENKTGDTFDAAFINEMVAHHRGAIDMANFALVNAKHQEVKDLAKNIINAQTSEIIQMKSWQSTWGYTNTPTMNGHHMMDM